MFCACTFTGTCPTACTASVWNVTFFSLQIFAISSIGCNVPISLFAYIIVTNAVSSRIAFSTSAGSTIPSAPTSSNVTSKPSRSNFLEHGERHDVQSLWKWVFLTLLCSKKSSRTNSLVVCFASAGSKVNLIKICT